MSFGENDISREARVRIQGNQFKGPESDHFGVHVTAAGQEALEQAERLLEGIPNGIERALSGAIRRATAHMQSVSKKAVRERYAGDYFAFIRDYYQLGGRVVTLGSDAHQAADLAADFDVAMDILTGVGFRYFAFYRQRQPVMLKLI